MPKRQATYGLDVSNATPVATYVEYLAPSPDFEEIVTVPFTADSEGCLLIPDKPGLGVELNRSSGAVWGATHGLQSK